MYPLCKVKGQNSLVIHHSALVNIINLILFASTKIKTISLELKDPSKRKFNFYIRTQAPIKQLIKESPNLTMILKLPPHWLFSLKNFKFVSQSFKLINGHLLVKISTTWTCVKIGSKSTLQLSSLSDKIMMISVSYPCMKYQIMNELNIS